MATRRRISAALAVALVVALVGCSDEEPTATDPGPTVALSPLASDPVTVVNPNAGWCWWQSRRAIITADGDLLATSVPSSKGADGRSKSIDVTSVDVGTRQATVTSLMQGTLRSDDHNDGALIELPSGRVVTTWSGHAEEPRRYVAWRDPGSTEWVQGAPVERPESMDVPADGSRPPRVTYANLMWSPHENGGRGRLYDMFRGRWNEWSYQVSDDEGETWTYGGSLFDSDGGLKRPYAHWAADDDGRIWFTIGDDHPTYAEMNGLYAGYLADGRMYRTDGTEVAVIGERRPDPDEFTLVYRPRESRTVTWGSLDWPEFADSEAWGAELRIDPEGVPVAVFSVRRPAPSPRAGKNFVNDYRWARLRPDGSWHVSLIANGGSELYEQQPNYSGLLTIDPDDPYRVFASTDVHPLTGSPLVSAATGAAQHEIWEGRSSNGGLSWTWQAVTHDSPSDNIRPVAVSGHGSWALVWVRGTYTNFQDDYDLEMAAIIHRD